MRACLLLTLILANVFDAMATVHAFERGVEELNPLMAALLLIDLRLFLIAKVVGVSILMAFVCAFAPMRWLLLVSLVYLGVVGFHVWGVG